MAKTYEEFLACVPETEREFVNIINELLISNDCKVEIKEAKRGCLVTYFYRLNKKKISLMNYVFRKQGMIVRIYARHIANYDDMLNGIPEGMKKAAATSLDCKRLNGVSECSPTCTAGYDFMMDGENYKKCKNSAFFWQVCDENNAFIKQMIENEIKYLGIE